MVDAFEESAYHKRKWEAGLHGRKLRGLKYNRKFKSELKVFSAKEEAMMAEWAAASSGESSEDRKIRLRGMTSVQNNA